MANSKQRRTQARLSKKEGLPLTSKKPKVQNPVKSESSKNVPWIWAKGVFVAGGTLLAYVFLVPHLSLSKDFMGEIHNPTTESFYVENEGLLPAMHLSAICSESQIPGTNLRTGNTFDNDTKIVLDFASALHYKAKASIPCSRGLRVSPGIMDGDFLMTVKIRYLVVGLFHRTQIFYFHANQNRDNTYTLEYLQ